MGTAISGAAAWVANTVSGWLAGAGASSGIASAAGSAAYGVVGYAAYAVTYVGLSAAVAAGVSELTKPDSGGIGASQGRELQLQIDPTFPRQLCIGRRLVAGSLSAHYSCGPNRERLHLVVPLVDHPVQQCARVFGDGRLVYNLPLAHGVRTEIPWDDRIGGLVYMTFWDGRPGQTYDSNLVSESAIEPDVVAGRKPAWTTAHKGAGIAWVHIELGYNPNVMTSMPSFLFDIIGTGLYDRRLDSTAGGSGSHRLADPSTWRTAFSDNPATALDHFLLGMKVENDDLAFGVGLRTDDVPYASFEAAADLADEDIVTGEGEGEETIKRYRANGVVSASDTFEDVIEALQLQMGARLVDYGGRIGIVPAEERTPVCSLSDGDWVTDDSVSFEDRRTFDDLVGAVEGRFADPANVYQPTPYEAQRAPEASFADGGEAATKTLELPFEVHSRRAARLARIWLERERRQAKLSGTFTFAAWELEPGDWFSYSSTHEQLEDELFEVIDLVKNADFTVTLTAQAVDAGIVAFDNDNDPDLSEPVYLEPVDIKLDVPEFDVEATTLTAGTVVEPALLFTLTSDDSLVREIVIERAQWDAGSSEFVGSSIYSVHHADEPTTVLRTGILPSTAYKVRCKSRAGRKESEWAEWSAPVTTGSSYVVGGASEVPWTGVTDPDDTRPDDNADVTLVNTSMDTLAAAPGSPLRYELDSLDLNAFDIIPAGLHAAIVAQTSTEDLTDFLDEAIETSFDEKVRLILPNGLFWTSGNVLKSGVSIMGRGSETKLKLVPGANTHVLMSEGAEGLVGSNGYGGIERGSIEYLELDGNFDENTSGSGLFLYGDEFAIRMVRAINCADHFLVSEWGPYGEESMEAVIDGFWGDRCKKDGIIWRGPHDSVNRNIFLVDAGQGANAMYSGVKVEGNGASQWMAAHAWHRSTVTNRMRYAFDSRAYGSTFLDCHGEGAVVGQVNMAGQYSRWDAGRAYAAFDGGAQLIIRQPSYVKGIFLGGPASMEPDSTSILFGGTEIEFDGGTSAFTVGQTVTGGSSGATGVIRRVHGSTAAGMLDVAITSGAFADGEAITDGAGGAATVNGLPAPANTTACEIEGYYGGRGPVVDFTDEAGKNKVSVFGVSASPEIVGTPNPQDEINIGVWNYVTGERYTRRSLPGDTAIERWIDVSVQQGIVAAGTTAGTATQLQPGMVVSVGTVAAGAGVRMVASAPGREVLVANNGANVLAVWPAAGEEFAGNGTDAAYYIDPGRAAIFKASAASSWNVVDNTGRQKISHGVTAAGTNQSTATALGEYGYVLVATVGSGQGVRLPSVRRSKGSWVFNASATSLLVYPATGEYIYAAGSTNLPVTIPAGEGGFFASTADGAWFFMPGLAPSTFGRSVAKAADAGAVRTLLGLDTSASPQFAEVNIGHATDTTLTRVAAGRIAVEGAELAKLASPAFTGVPTAPTASAGVNTTQIATTAFVATAVAALVDSSPSTLDTLNELAAALGDDPNFATTTATALGLKAPLASPALTGVPTAPTATLGTNTTQIATTAFVQAALGAYVNQAVKTTSIPSFAGMILAPPAYGGIIITGQAATGSPVDLQWRNSATLRRWVLRFAADADGNDLDIVKFNTGGSYDQTPVSLDWATGRLTLNQTPYVGGDAVFHAGNDGHLSGLDADRLDGLEGAAFAVLANAQNFTATQQISAGAAATATNFLSLTPTDMGTGKPGLYFQKSATATLWEVLLWDGVNNAGTINIKAGALQHNGSNVLTVATGGAGSGFNADLVRSVTPSTYGLSLLDDADAAAARATLALGTAAVVNTGTSGATIPLLNGGATTWANGSTWAGSVAPNSDNTRNLGEPGARWANVYGVQGHLVQMNLAPSAYGGVAITGRSATSNPVSISWLSSAGQGRFALDFLSDTDGNDLQLIAYSGGAYSGHVFVVDHPTRVLSFSNTPLVGANPIYHAGNLSTYAATIRSGIGLGTSATYNVGTSGDVLARLSTAQTWGATQSFAIVSIGGSALQTVGDDLKLDGPFLATGLIAEGAYPFIDIRDTDGGADAKNWRWLANGGALYLQAFEDDYGGATNPVILNRTGITVDSLDLRAITKTIVNALGVNNAAAATTPGSVVKKIEIFDGSGASLGYLAVYSSIS